MKIVAISNKGVKPNNEDCYLIDNKCFYNEAYVDSGCKSLFVFDGVSNSNNGKEAAILASNLIAKEKKFIKFDENKLRNFLSDLNNKIKQELNGAYTTIAGINIIGDKVRVINIGDSSVYRIREGLIKKLTLDDTYYAYLRQINDPKADDYKNSHIITACLGMDDFNKNNIHIKDIEFGLMEKDYYIICSDGISDLINEAELLEIIDNENELVEKSKAISNLVDQRGAKDNYTLLILEV